MIIPKMNEPKNSWNKDRRISPFELKGRALEIKNKRKWLDKW